MSCFARMCKSLKPDDISLSYHDSLLRVRDVDLLYGNSWINDQLIQFYFEYLEHSMFEGYRHFLFMHPSVTRAMREHQDRRVYLDPLNAERKQFIFMALNNSSTVDDSGTHWTLLIFSRPEKTFYHYDSLTIASSFDVLQPFLCGLSMALGCPNYSYVESASKIQVNNHDCGLYVMYNAEVLARRIINYGMVVPDAEALLADRQKMAGYDDPMDIKYTDLPHKRDEIVKIIRKLGGRY